MAQLDREHPRHETVMDVTEEQIARVYAQAFMGAAAKTPDASALVEEVQSLVEDVLDRFPQFEQTLKSALISPEEKDGLLDRVFAGRANPLVLNFLKVLSKHGRLGLLRPIARLLHKLDADRRGLKDVEVRVAVPLDDGLRSEIENQLRTMLGSEPILHVVVDPSLIAGMMIRVGDRVYDSSVQTQFEHARRAMIERATEKIEVQPDKFLFATP
jgi:F-type H+-transporting ATPase subunit delta